MRGWRGVVIGLFGGLPQLCETSLVRGVILHVDDAVAMVDEVGVVRCRDHGGAGLRALEQQFYHEVSVRCIQ